MKLSNWLHRAAGTVGAVAIVFSQYESMLPPWGRKISAAVGALALLLTNLKNLPRGGK